MVQIRERSFLDLLDLSLIVARRRPFVLALAAVVGILPCAAFNYWVAQQPAFQEVYAEQVVLPWFEAPLATAPLTVVLGGLMFGERTSFRGVARTLAASFVPLVFYQVIVRALVMATVLVYPLIPARLVFLNEVILLERGKWRRVVGRSATLCGQQGAELFLQWLAQLVFGAVFGACFWVGSGALVHALASSEITWDEPAGADLYGFRFQCALWLTIAFFGVVRFMSYIDQRIRLEGWEVALRLRSVGRALEEARSW